MGIKVIFIESGEDQKSIFFGIYRELLKSILGYFIVPIIWLFWDKNYQNLYDKIVKTIVFYRKVESLIAVSKNLIEKNANKKNTKSLTIINLIIALSL